MRSGDWNEVIGGKRYNTDNADLIADDAYWDGKNYERRGRNRFLFKTQKGNYFQVQRTQWREEVERLTPLTQDEAITVWEELPEHHVSFEDAFPGVEVEDA